MSIDQLAVITRDGSLGVRIGCHIVILVVGIRIGLRQLGFPEQHIHYESPEF
jgi:hypothetical protein